MEFAASSKKDAVFCCFTKFFVVKTVFSFYLEPMKHEMFSIGFFSLISQLYGS